MYEYQVAEEIFKAENVCLSFGEKVVLRDVNFSIKNVTRKDLKQGQVISLCGRSGIGKSQLFKICAGLKPPTSGAVKIGSNLIDVKSGDVGVIPQNYLLFKHRTIRKNLELAVVNQTKDSKVMKEMIEHHAQEFHLMEHLDKYPMQLSGGQRQRVSILQQILTGNKFIFLDEPFSGLDSVMIEKVLKLLLKISLMDEYCTMVIVSHDIPNSVAISDDVWVLAKEEGREGATVIKEYDLKKMGLAWRENMRNTSAFTDLVNEIKKIM